MKKTALAALLLAWCVAPAFAQTAGILPFTGGLGTEGETMAALLSSSPEIRQTFTLVPVADAAASEHLLRASAFTDSDLAAATGRAIGADYVVSGHIRRLGNRNLVIATVVRVATLELAAGYYRTFRNFREIPGFLPSMSATLAGATRDRGPLPSLAVAPFAPDPASAADGTEDPRTEAEEHDLETLAQILAIRIAETGGYTVLPRASHMRAALTAWEIRAADERAAALERLIDLLMGILDTPDEAAAAVDYETGAVTEIGRAAGADRVLSVETRNLGEVTMLTAQMHQTRDGSLLDVVSRGYRTPGEGVNLMSEIAILLADPPDAQERIAAANRRQRRAATFGDPARFWSLGLSAGSSFSDPWAIGTIHATLSPLPFSFIRLGFAAGFVSEIEGADFFSIHPFAQAAFFMPFPAGRGGVFLGAGGGLAVIRYNFDGMEKSANTPTADITAGVNIANLFELSYTLRTDFSLLSSKVSAGFTHRFRARDR